ncbi:O-succinylhomoserine sulfhydrylase [Radicibacter daui]|uniref:O-succinylhomoserine sulfhydrylase n=1 Tax=Radicibacter daui TaxID=3064829 RepID=UPI004046AF09
MARDKKLPGNLDPRTLMVHGGTQRSGFDETSEALFMTSGYVYGTAEEAEEAFKTDGLRYVYSRYRNPTVSMFEDRLALLEGASGCQGAASGMAAMTLALFGLTRAGSRVVASRALFGSCLYLITDMLPRYGVETVLVDPDDLNQWADAFKKPTDVAFLETPSNPGLVLADLPAIAKLAHAAGAKVVVDNAFASPVLQKPLSMGADVVAYSTTKHIDGQGRAMGGAVLSNDPEFFKAIQPFVRHTGPSLSPFNAWLMLKGLETLDLRVNAMADSALEVATYLESHPKLRKVMYPGLASHPQHALAKAQMKKGGTMVALHLEGGKEEAFRLLNALNVIPISNNLGDSKSLATHPATTTHQRLSDEERAAAGIHPGTIRLSVGLEAASDLIADLDQALKKV